MERAGRARGVVLLLSWMGGRTLGMEISDEQSRCPLSSIPPLQIFSSQGSWANTPAAHAEAVIHAAAGGGDNLEVGKVTHGVRS